MCKQIFSVGGNIKYLHYEWEVNRLSACNIYIMMTLIFPLLKMVTNIHIYEDSRQKQQNIWMNPARMCSEIVLIFSLKSVNTEAIGVNTYMSIALAVKYKHINCMLAMFFRRKYFSMLCY